MLKAKYFPVFGFILTYRFIIHADSSLPISVHLFGSFVHRVQYSVVHAHVLRPVHFDIQPQAAMRKQCRFAKLRFRRQHGNTHVQTGNVLACRQYADKLLRHFVAEGIAHDDHYLFLYPFNQAVVEILLPEPMYGIHAACVFHTTHPFQIDTVAQLGILHIQVVLHFLHRIVKGDGRAYFTETFHRLPVQLINQVIFVPVFMEIVVRLVQGNGT